MILANGKTTTVVGHFDLEMREKILEIINERRGRFEISASFIYQEMILHFKMLLIQEQLKSLILIHTLDQMEREQLLIFMHMHKLMQKILQKVNKVQNRYVMIGLHHLLIMRIL